MPARPMLHADDPRKDIWEKIGDLSRYELLHNQVLCAIYMRPERTQSGLYLPDKTRDEDAYQGKVALIVKTGPDAFVSDGAYRWPEDMGEGDWVFFRVSDGWSQNVNGVQCRVVKDDQIRGRIPNPDMVY